MENKMRSTLNEIYFGKTKDICNDLRCVSSLFLSILPAPLPSTLGNALWRQLFY
jgi:hypothetical protein